MRSDRRVAPVFASPARAAQARCGQNARRPGSVEPSPTLEADHDAPLRRAPSRPFFEPRRECERVFGLTEPATQELHRETQALKAAVGGFAQATAILRGQVRDAPRHDAMAAEVGRDMIDESRHARAAARTDRIRVLRATAGASSWIAGVARRWIAAHLATRPAPLFVRELRVAPFALQREMALVTHARPATVCRLQERDLRAASTGSTRVTLPPSRTVVFRVQRRWKVERHPEGVREVGAHPRGRCRFRPGRDVAMEEAHVAPEPKAVEVPRRMPGLFVNHCEQHDHPALRVAVPERLDGDGAAGVRLEVGSRRDAHRGHAPSSVAAAALHAGRHDVRVRRSVPRARGRPAPVVAWRPPFPRCPRSNVRRSLLRMPVLLAPSIVDTSRRRALKTSRSIGLVLARRVGPRRRSGSSLDAATAVCHVPVMHPPAVLAPGAKAARLP